MRAGARPRRQLVNSIGLAADGIMPERCIAFEKGRRSWPNANGRRAMPRWPPGTIARLRHGEPASVEHRAEPTVEPGDDVPLIAQAVVTAVSTFGTAVEALPSVEDPAFTPRATKILADLRQLEAVAARAARISKVSPPLIKALSAVRTRYDELMLRAARAPRATVGQRLYAARRGANLTILETAQAAGVSEEDIIGAEAEEPVSAAAVREIESLIEQLN